MCNALPYPTAVRTKDSSDGTPLDRCPAATACTPAAPLTEGHEQEQQQENADDDDADYSQEQLAATPGERGAAVGTFLPAVATPGAHAILLYDLLSCFFNMASGCKPKAASTSAYKQS